jgi:hypothetical protein
LILFVGHRRAPGLLFYIIGIFLFVVSLNISAIILIVISRADHGQIMRNRPINNLIVVLLDFVSDI